MIKSRSKAGTGSSGAFIGIHRLCGTLFPMKLMVVCSQLWSLVHSYGRLFIVMVGPHETHFHAGKKCPYIPAASTLHVANWRPQIWKANQSFARNFMRLLQAYVNVNWDFELDSQPNSRDRKCGLNPNMLDIASDRQKIMSQIERKLLRV